MSLAVAVLLGVLAVALVVWGASSGEDLLEIRYLDLRAQFERRIAIEDEFGEVCRPLKSRAMTALFWNALEKGRKVAPHASFSNMFVHVVVRGQRHGERVDMALQNNGIMRHNGVIWSMSGRSQDDLQQVLELHCYGLSWVLVEYLVNPARRFLGIDYIGQVPGEELPIGDGEPQHLEIPPSAL